jgi:hypothetical protein
MRSLGSNRSLAACFVVSLAACGGPAPRTDAGEEDAGHADADRTDAGQTGLPQLGVYVVGTDGSSFRLLLDTGTRQLTHVRRQPEGEWFTATRYNDDIDGNGYAMELEAGYGAYYGEAEVVVAPLDDLGSTTTIAGAVPGRLCANSSWTDDGRLLFIQQDHPSDPNWTRLKRARFSALPAVESIDVVPTPPELLLPIDPHQIGASDETGSIVFAAFYQHAAGWMRPVWRMPASGTLDLASAPLVGCPICGDGCCAWPAIPEVLGTNDPRMSHAGTDVIWMQQHPDISIGDPPLHPVRQAMRSGDEPQVDLTPPGVDSVASQAFVEWRDDDAEVVYWSIEIEDGAVRQHLYRMRPDGTERVRIPIPAELCAQHPSYSSRAEIVFTGWRCAGTPCSCDVGRI